MEKFEYIYKANVIKVYDGDTITVIVDLGFKIKTTEKIRLSNIDTPEIRGSEREDGLVSKKWLLDKILGKDIILKTFRDKKGKYGRYIGEIYLEGEEISLNEQLINNGLAERY